MNLTTTRAAHTACAEPGIALRRLNLNEAVEPQCDRRSNGSHDGFSAADEVQRERCPVLTENELFGMVLLGIGYDSSVA
jgi:hypothetical protein